jgi:hypothetical protein
MSTLPLGSIARSAAHSDDCGDSGGGVAVEDAESEGDEDPLGVSAASWGPPTSAGEIDLETVGSSELATEEDAAPGSNSSRDACNAEDAVDDDREVAEAGRADSGTNGAFSSTA